MAESVFAGAIVGYVMAVVFSVLLALVIVELRAGSERMREFITPTLSLPLIATAVFTIAFWVWPAMGLLVGLAYGATREDGTDALGSPHIWFTLAILTVSLPQAAAISLLVRRLHPAVVGYVAVFAAAFGWVMPWLAESNL
ncbi:MAG: hypothetical protein WEB00_00710 [Dehalococcoidia bacterium]